ncbi:glycosyltransferase family 25 protein [Sphingomonas oleivorans]|nr:glycosyltransferase family 25 protein [Sphingomonas oleivorans]
MFDPPGSAPPSSKRLTAIRVISMAGDAERRQQFASRAAGTSAPWSFFDACTQLSPDLTYDRETLLIHKGRELLPGERGNYTSHFTLWQELLASDYEQYIVLEDDVYVEWPYLERLANVRLSDYGIGYLNLIVKRLSHFREVGNFGERYLVQFMGYTHGTCYVVTRALAKMHLEHFRVIRGNFDNMLDRSWVHGIPNYCVYPLPVLELGYKVASRIGNGTERFAAETIPFGLKVRRAINTRKMALARSAYIAQQHVLQSVRPPQGPKTF